MKKTKKAKTHAEQKATTFVESLPYLKKFHGKTIVVKLGGHVLVDAKLRDIMLMDLALLKFIGVNPIVVHGGGPGISKEMEKKGIKPVFVHGQRVTDSKVIKIVDSVFKKINKNLVAGIKKNGSKAVGLSGYDHSLVKAVKMNPKLGLVGKVKQINTEVIKTLIKDSFIPVVSPISVGAGGEHYNVNADTVATALAVKLKAEKLTILTDVEGVLDKKKKLISSLSISNANKLIKKGVISAGMIPKVGACITAVKGGCKKAHLIDGNVEHSLFIEIFTKKGIGTEIVK